jgi:hypothetical protein
MTDPEFWLHGKKYIPQKNTGNSGFLLQIKKAKLCKRRISKSCEAVNKNLPLRRAQGKAFDQYFKDEIRSGSSFFLQSLK